MSNPAIQGRATRFATDNPLNSPIWAALNSSHRKFAHGGPLALRYFPDVAPFGALADRTAEAFAALATLVPRDGRVVLQAADALVPFSGLKVDMQKPILQMVLDAPVAASPSGPDHMVLGHTDVDAMMDLADRTRPGPFGSGTIDLGRYIGIRFDEVLAAMAGEVGLGIAASGTIIPKLLLIGLKETWIGLGVLSLLLTATSWFGWPDAPPHAAGLIKEAHSPKFARGPLLVLYGQYALNALGVVPAMILLVDYVVRGLKGSAQVGAAYWILYGVAATMGPVVCGLSADRIGYRSSYRVALLLQAIAGLLLATSSSTISLVIGTTILVLVLALLSDFVLFSDGEQCRGQG